jgi:hypothetical protein
MKRAFRYSVAALIIAATISACGNGDGEENPPVVLEQYEWVALEQLLPPTPPPEKGEYAIQVGQFADAEAADVVSNRVRASDLPSSIIPVVDKDGLHWFVVSAGSFESLDGARANRLPISHDLGLSDPPPIILLPQ